MGDIIQRFQVRSSGRRTARPLRLLFDTGSPVTLVKESSARTLGGLMELPKPRAFGGLGNGQFQATHLVELEFRFLGIWCPHVCYVVPNDVLDSEYEALVGHDLMQRYDVQPRPKRRRVSLHRGALEMGLRVRSLPIHRTLGCLERRWNRLDHPR